MTHNPTLETLQFAENRAVGELQSAVYGALLAHDHGATPEGWTHHWARLQRCLDASLATQGAVINYLCERTEA